MIIITDWDNIESITFKYPELMDKDAENKIKERFYSAKADQEKLYKLREEERELESRIKDTKDYIQSLSEIIEIKYPTYEKEYKINTVNIGFNMSSEINKEVH